MSDTLNISVGILDSATGKFYSASDISIQRECELRSRAGDDSGLSNKALQDESLPIQASVGVLPHRFNFALKAVNACKRLGKLLLQRFKCGHGTKPVTARQEGGKP